MKKVKLLFIVFIIIVSIAVLMISCNKNKESNNNDNNNGEINNNEEELMLEEKSDFVITNSGILTAYTGSGIVVDIPENVTSIGSSAFKNNRLLQNVTFPAGLEEIRDSAFEGCVSLKNIIIPEGVTYIGEKAFYGDSNLTSIKIPSTTSRIGEKVVANCSKLEEIVINNGNTLYDSRDNANAIIDSNTNVLLAGCKSTRIPTSVTSIQTKAFLGSGIESIIVPSSVTQIGEGAFGGCSSLRAISVPFVGGTKYSEDSYYQYPLGYIFGKDNYTGSTAVKQYYYGSSTTSTAYDTYYIPSMLENVNITFTNYIQYGALYGLGQLTSVVLPDELEIIGAKAFYDCKKILEINLPETLEKVRENAFEKCEKLQKVNISNAQDFCNISFESETSNPIYYAHKLYIDNVEVTSIIIGDSTTRLSRYVIEGLTGLTSLTIPNAVTYIEKGALSKLTSLETITIPFVGRELNGSYPFGFIFGTTSYANSIQVYEKNMNYYIPNTLRSIIVTQGTSLPEYAFADCSCLTSISLPNTITTIEVCAFSGCSNLSNINIPTSLNDLAISAFEDCSNLQSISLPSGVTKIKFSTFRGCSNLITIAISNNITNIGQNSFTNCRSLTTVNYNGTIEQWGAITKSNPYNTNVPSTCVVHCTDGDSSF